MHFPQKPSKGQSIRAELIGQIIDCLRMFRPIAGPNIRVNTTPGGSIITGTPGGVAAVSSTAPFTVRRHEDQWEIYLPDGCCNYGGTCYPVNEAASTGGDDHAGDYPGWRILHLDESTGTTGTDAAGNTYREWNVEIHVKPSAKMYGVDGLNEPARRLVWACAADRLKLQSDLTDAERYANSPGDAWSCVVARVRVTSGEGGAEPARTVTPIREIPVDVAAGETPTGFDLVWYFSVDDGALKVEKVFCLRQNISVAGMTVTGDTMTDVTGAEYVYARIDTKDMTDGRGLISVVSDPGNDVHTSGNLVTWLILFRMNNDAVTEDYRENSIRNIQLYRA